jgi:endonuclease/exonuclease/phosphatase family metal-dependent hydrolase
MALVGGLVLAWGADRQPVNSNQPVAWMAPATAQPPIGETLRIASYNIHGGKGTDRQRDLMRIAADLRDVDFAGLYEVHATPGGEFRDQAADLGERLGMRSAFLGTERRWWHDHFGNAVLTNLPVDYLQRIPLSGTRGKAYRQAVLLGIPFQGETVHVLMAHIDREQDREAQLHAVIQMFRALNSPAVLMGDLNTGPDDPAMQELLKDPGLDSVIHSHLKDSAPGHNIDWLIVRGLDCIAAEYLASGASDHPIIKAKLRLKPH